MDRLQDKEQWLKNVQQKLKKHMKARYWKKLQLPENLISIIDSIMKAKSSRDLTPLINNNFTEMMFDMIDKEIRNHSNRDFAL